MINIKRLIVGLIHFLGLQLYAQVGWPFYDGVKYPGGPDTLYYPYYNGVQMIEIDYVGQWEENEGYEDAIWGARDQARFTDVPESMYNAYLFRNRAGKIVKAFNTSTPIDSLNYVFQKIPVNKKSTSDGISIVYHNRKRDYNFHLDYPSRKNAFGGYYPVCNDSFKAGTLFFSQWIGRSHGKIGLIDSFGNYFLPVEFSFIEPLDDYIILYKDSMCGVIDHGKKEILPMEYDRHQYLEAMEDVAFYQDNQLKMIFNRKSEKFRPLAGYDWIGQDWLWRCRNDQLPGYPPFVPVRSGMLCGLVDTNFNVVTPLIYDMCLPAYSDGLTLVCRNNKFGYLDKNGKEVIPCIYDYGERFIKGFAVVQYKGIYKCIDVTGAETTMHSNQHEKWRNHGGYYDNYSYIPGFEVIQTITGYGLVNDSGRVVVPPIYENLNPISIIKNGKREISNTAIEVRKFDKLGVIDTTGNILLPCSYKLIADYGSRTGLRSVQSYTGLWGMVNAKWEIVIPCIYSGLNISTDADYIIFVDHGSWGVMDTTGKITIPAIYNQINGFNDGRSVVQKDTLFGMIDREGNVIVPIKYNQLSSEFYNGLVMCCQNNKWGFLDTTGKIVIPIIYDEVRNFEQSITGVEKGDKFGFINRAGKLVVPYQYEYVGWEWYYDGTVQVKQNGKIGLMDATGKIVIPIIYDREWGSGPGYGHNLEKDGKREWVKVE